MLADLDVAVGDVVRLEGTESSDGPIEGLVVEITPDTVFVQFVISGVVATTLTPAFPVDHFRDIFIERLPRAASA